MIRKELMRLGRQLTGVYGLLVLIITVLIGVYLYSSKNFIHIEIVPQFHNYDGHLYLTDGASRNLQSQDERKGLDDLGVNSTRIYEHGSKVVPHEMARTETTQFPQNIGEMSALFSMYNYPPPDSRVHAVDCAAITQAEVRSGWGRVSQAILSLVVIGHNTAVYKSKYPKLNSNQSLPNISLYTNAVHNCDDFKQKRGYLLSPMTREEAEFPIAFSILLYKDFGQAEGLLRAIYRPQNFYCLHVDRSSPAELHIAAAAMASCFDNVFLPQEIVDVRWGHMSVLTAELVCIRTLLRHKHWKYFINLTGQEFPLKTNLQLVRILKSYNETNDITGLTPSDTVRWEKRWERKGRPPYNLTMSKGDVHITATREFCEFLFQDPRVNVFLRYLQGTFIPDESFFTTLNHNPQFGTPGAFKGPTSMISEKRFMTRLKLWYGSKSHRCRGKIVRQICIFGVADLLWIVSRPELFVNKLHWDFQPYTLKCLTEWHYNRTRDEYLGKYVFDVSEYQQLPQVRYKSSDAWKS